MATFKSLLGNVFDVGDFVSKKSTLEVLWFVVILIIIFVIFDTICNFILPYITNPNWKQRAWEFFIWIKAISTLHLFQYIHNEYAVYLHNRSLFEDSTNLTVYPNRKAIFSRLEKFPVFKKCDFSKNVYYWRVKTKDSDYFYTDNSDETETLKSILRATKMKKRLVNDFFEYCLISYLLDEVESDLEVVSRGRPVTKSNVLIKTQDFYKIPNNAEEETTPDVVLEFGGQTWVFDAYNGTSEKEILRKCQSYRRDFKTPHVYVFSSGFSALEQISAQSSATFRLTTLNDQTLEIVSDPIIIGDLSISISELNERYRNEFLVFWNEIFYWQHCEQQNRILKVKERRLTGSFCA